MFRMLNSGHSVETLGCRMEGSRTWFRSSSISRSFLMLILYRLQVFISL